MPAPSLRIRNPILPGFNPDPSIVLVVRRYSVPLIAPTAAWGSFAHWVFSFV